MKSGNELAVAGLRRSVGYVSHCVSRGSNASYKESPGSSPGGATESAASDFPVAALSLFAAPRAVSERESGSGSRAGAA